jgi:hypothetical protein
MSQSSVRDARSPLARAGLLVVLIAAAGLGLLGSACGGSSGATTTTGSGATASGSTNESKRGALVAFSACMRRNGVPKFPDPESAGSGFRITLGDENGIDVSSPKFRSAEEACKKLLPNGGAPDPREQAERLQQAREYAACMRSHGVPKFPDPKLSGNGGIDVGTLGPRVGADPNSPQFKAAEKACGRLAPRAGGPAPSGSRNAG